MFKVLIVDDEKPIVEGLKVFINWAEYGFEIAGEALNGQKGVELAEKLLPHLIVTDIRMPILDGLEMIEKIKCFNPDCKFIILSGYSDFEYARDAVSKGVFSYLLKPVKERELTEKLLMIREELERKDYKKSEEERLRKQLHESLPVLRERYLNEIVTGEVNSIEEILKRWEFLDTGYNLKKFCVLIIEIDDLYEKYHDDIENRLLMKFAVTNITEEIVNDFKAGVVFDHNHERLVVLCCGWEKLDENNLYRLAGRIRHCMENYIKESVTIAAGGIYSNVVDIHKSFSEAENALKYKLIYGNNSFIGINDVKLSDDKYSMPIELEKKLVTFVEIGDRENALDCLDSIFDKILDMEYSRPEYIHYVNLNLLVLISRHLLSLGFYVKDMLENGDFSVKSLLYIKTADSLKAHMKKVIASAIEVVNSARRKKVKGILGQVIEYIEGSYNEELSLESLGNKFFINPSYLSQLFKKELGCTFIEFLTKTRMENAKRLLQNTDFMVYEVSSMVGYHNQRYFSHVFEKYTGFTPTDYKGRMIPDKII